MRVLCVYRDEKYSPGMADKDAAIMDAVALCLRKSGDDVTCIREDALSYHCSPDVVFSMARSQSALDILAQMKKNGVKVINDPDKLKQYCRSHLLRLFTENNIHVPCYQTITSDSAVDRNMFPLWIKKSEGWSQQRDDVQYVADGEEFDEWIGKNGLIDDHFIAEHHTEGDLIKFYGVSGSGFFRWHYANDGHSKFGLESINGEPQHYCFSEKELYDICARAASVSDMAVYGGDAVIGADGSITIIDFNDWPSYSKYRDEAAEAIASLADDSVEESRAESLAGKSRDTEEWLDVVFTRPIGYRWALFFNRFGIHPNVVTVLSMILGAASGFFFVHDADTTEGVIYNIIGILLLMWANFYDSCDGQLARMTGKKTRTGRILDGFAGDVWFFSIYVAIAVRIFHHMIPLTSIEWGIWGWLMVIVSGFVFHARQCSLADYYRNIHLFFLKGRAGSELDNYPQQRAIADSTPWHGNWLWKPFLISYANYTHSQERQTPQFQTLLRSLKQRYGDDIPQSFREKFRALSLPMMKWANILTFNTRAIMLYVCCVLDVPWLYPVLEMSVFTLLYLYMRNTHESFCRHLCEKIQ